MNRSTAEAGITKFVQSCWTAHALGEKQNADYASRRFCRILVEYGQSRYGQTVDLPFDYVSEYEEFVDAPTADSRKRIAERVAGMWLDRLDRKAVSMGLQQASKPTAPTKPTVPANPVTPAQPVYMSRPNIYPAYTPVRMPTGVVVMLAGYGIFILWIISMGR
jgi:hypothetical protein